MRGLSVDLMEMHTVCPILTSFGKDALVVECRSLHIYVAPAHAYFFYYYFLYSKMSVAPNKREKNVLRRASCDMHPLRKVDMDKVVIVDSIGEREREFRR